MPKEDADKLASFVEDGGTVIGFAKLAHLDEKGWSWNQRPGAGLTDLFGARETHLEVFDRRAWAWNDTPGAGLGMFGTPSSISEEFLESEKALAINVDPDHPLFEGIESDTLSGYWHRQTFELADDVEVLARFVDGAPAIVRRRQGLGQAILMATHLDIAVVEHNDAATRRLFANLLGLCGVTRSVVVTGSDQAYIQERVDAHLLESDHQRAVLINNEGETSVDLTVTLPGATDAVSATELFSNASLDLTQSGGASFSIVLGAADGVIVMLS